MIPPYTRIPAYCNAPEKETVLALEVISAQLHELATLLEGHHPKPVTGRPGLCPDCTAELEFSTVSRAWVCPRAHTEEHAPKHDDHAVHVALNLKATACCVCKAEGENFHMPMTAYCGEGWYCHTHMPGNRPLP